MNVESEEPPEWSSAPPSVAPDPFLLLRPKILDMSLTLPLIFHISSPSKFCPLYLQNIYSIQPLLITPASIILLQDASICLLDHCNFYSTCLPVFLSLPFSICGNQSEPQKIQILSLLAQMLLRFLRTLDVVTLSSSTSLPGDPGHLRTDAHRNLVH